jgi:hypothetical protein
MGHGHWTAGQWPTRGSGHQQAARPGWRPGGPPPATSRPPLNVYGSKAFAHGLNYPLPSSSSLRGDEPIVATGLFALGPADHTRRVHGERGVRMGVAQSPPGQRPASRLWPRGYSGLEPQSVKPWRPNLGGAVPHLTFGAAAQRSNVGTGIHARGPLFSPIDPCAVEAGVTALRGDHAFQARGQHHVRTPTRATSGANP